MTVSEGTVFHVTCNPDGIPGKTVVVLLDSTSPKVMIVLTKCGILPMFTGLVHKFMIVHNAPLQRV